MKYFFMLVTMIVLAVTGLSDTTYVCDEVGDWDQWSVPTYQQQKMVDEGWSMTIYETANGYEATTSDGYNLMAVCKPKSTCYDLCTQSDKDNGDCPCTTCTIDPGSSGIRNYVSRLIDLYA